MRLTKNTNAKKKKKLIWLVFPQKSKYFISSDIVSAVWFQVRPFLSCLDGNSYSVNVYLAIHWSIIMFHSSVSVGQTRDLDSL